VKLISNMQNLNSITSKLRLTKSYFSPSGFLALFFVVLSFNNLFSQCINADPFCTGTTYTFANTTNVADLGPVGCLDGTNTCNGGTIASTPNASWYYMEIDQAGPMTFSISQTSAANSALDVDYAMWGPYTSLAAGCGTGTFPIGNPIQTSYSPNTTETAALGALGGWDDVNCELNGCDGSTTPPAAQVGQFYIILMTNFSNEAGSITFNQTGGSGSADCSFTCGVNLTATPSVCSSNTYSVSGNLTVTGGAGISVPNTGTVTISNSCGGSPQTFNAPFTNIPYSFTGLTANGASCTVTATFTDFANCNSTQTYTAPASCNPVCNISSLTATPSACATGLYNVNGAVSFTNPPSSGTLTVTGSCGGTQTFNAPFTSPLNYNFTGLTANGNSCNVTATFSANTSCTNTGTYTAPNCVCNISSVTAVPSACNNDLYNLSGAVTFSNAPTTGTLTVTGSCGGTQTFNAPFTSPLNYNFTGLTANGNPCTVTATFSANNACTNTANYSAPASCLNPPCIMDAFCSGTTTFPAGTNQTSASTTFPNNNYGCLGSSPNPAWYYMEIAQSGDLGIDMTNSAGVDIDFILYGPYTSLSNANSFCDDMGNGTTTNTIVDCSYSGSASEIAYVPATVAGEVYVLLITNFSNSPTNISFTQSSGSASTDCSIVTGCNFTNFTGTTSACTGNNYSISGTISYTDPPSTGTLTLTSSCGGSQTFNAPFGTSSNYTISGLTGDGDTCSISASFSDGTCTASLNYTAPLCSCPAEIGTYNTNVTGSSNSLTKLCYGDQIDVTSNNNWTSPNEILGATDPTSPNYDSLAPVYDPGINWLVYSCPPSVSLTPSMSVADSTQIPDDPCLLGVISNTPNFGDLNDLSLINLFPSGTFTNNTVYYVPITMYSITEGTYSYVVLPAAPCYELGVPIVVQYLPEITYTQSTNCANGTASVTISGGSPELNGTNFSVVPGSLIPNTANFVNSTTGNGGIIVIGNLTTGPYSFDIVDDNGCPKSISGNYTGPETAALNYPDNTYCLNDANASPSIVGTQGGTYSSGAGLNINSTTGIINFQNSIPGSYTVTYTTPGPLCPATSTFNLTIEDFPIVDGGPDQTLCVGTPVILSGSGAVSYTWNNGLVDGYPYLPNLGENEFTVIGSSQAGCNGYDTVLVNVTTDCNPDIEIVFWVPNTFTPDGDQYNQTFKPLFYSGFDPFGYDLFIYNRWGELIWESHDLNVGWDGSYHEGVKVADGTYTWKIRFKLINNDEKRTVVGHVNVIR
jgi:gliding motility-associated-like protein